MTPSRNEALLYSIIAAFVSATVGFLGFVAGSPKATLTWQAASSLWFWLSLEAIGWAYWRYKTIFETQSRRRTLMMSLLVAIFVVGIAPLSANM